MNSNLAHKLSVLFVKEDNQGNGVESTLINYREEIARDI
jgi:hypothetical protein